MIVTRRVRERKCVHAPKHSLSLTRETDVLADLVIAFIAAKSSFAVEVAPNERRANREAGKSSSTGFAEGR